MANSGSKPAAAARCRATASSSPSTPPKMLPLWTNSTRRGFVCAWRTACSSGAATALTSILPAPRKDRDVHRTSYLGPAIDPGKDENQCERHPALAPRAQDELEYREHRQALVDYLEGRRLEHRVELRLACIPRERVRDRKRRAVWVRSEREIRQVSAPAPSPRRHTHRLARARALRYRRARPRCDSRREWRSAIHGGAVGACHRARAAGGV